MFYTPMVDPEHRKQKIYIFPNLYLFTLLTFNTIRTGARGDEGNDRLGAMYSGTGTVKSCGKWGVKQWIHYWKWVNITGSELTLLEAG